MDSKSGVDLETGEEHVDCETGETPALPQRNVETGEAELITHQPVMQNRKRFRVPSAYLRQYSVGDEPSTAKQQKQCNNKNDQIQSDCSGNTCHKEEFKYFNCGLFKKEKATPVDSSCPNSNKLVITTEKYSNNEITTTGDRIFTESYPVGSVVLFLLPTLFFCPLACAIVGSIIEAVLHWWAHKKNSQNAHKNVDKNKMVWYQSPMHLLASEFCFACIDEYGKEKISKYQDKRLNRRLTRIRKSMEYVRSIVI